MKTKDTKIYVAYASIILVALFLYVMQQVANAKERQELEQEPLLKTVAHIDLSTRDDLELVAVDYDNDVAFYKYVQPTRNIEIGETVKLIGGIEATLVYTDAVGFCIDCSSISTGMSGTAVQNMSGEQIGYISKRLPDNTVYCIWN